ncbi:RNA-splicing factor [Apophysomyces sp. BC1034]|nr:RNA-splicing factor [Apophysomyces sp. BC1015]KAG0182325.1 RNA-splicing factor [Apophysomyces sp. BC1021]KAG0194554.1 RNA-splicing factor [Apophysomyces sp. BC1034]
MGGGDLNLKKSWHPATFKNQERVWKEEKKHAEEQRKIEQMKKELAEERQLQELQRLQEQTSGRQRSDRLDWMYAAPNQGAAKPGGSEMEDFLLGKKNVDDLLRNKAASETVASSADERFALSNANANSERDIQAKIREDPLLMIKKREQQALKAIVDNPIRMKELTKKDKKKKKKDIKDKSDRHHRSSRHSSTRDRSRERRRHSSRERRRDSRERSSRSRYRE